MTGDSLPPGWTALQISDVLSPLSDGRILHHGWSPQCDSEPAGPGEWGALKTTAIQPLSFLPDHNKHLPPTLKPRPHLAVAAGDILITCAGPRARCGIACLVRKEAPLRFISGKMYRFRPRTDLVDPRYLEAYLQAPTTQHLINRMKTGISDSGLNLTHERFLKLPVPIAPLPEQSRIVEAIESNLARLDAASTSLLQAQSLLTRYEEALREFHLSGFNARDWKKATLGSLLRERLRNGLTTRTDGRDTGVRTLTLTAVTTGDFGLHNTKPSAIPRGLAEGMWLEHGDLLIERSNTKELVGTCALYEGPRDYAVFPDMVIRARVVPEVSTRFVLHSLQSRAARMYFQRMAKGVAGNMPKIDQPTISAVPLVLPPRSEQDRIASELDAAIAGARRWRREVEHALSSLEGLRRAILRAAFEGRLS